MKQLKAFAAVLALMVVVVACSGNREQAEPEVEITAPAEGSTFTLGDTVEITGTTEGKISERNVRVTVDGDTLDTAPVEDGAWSLNWRPPEAGTFEIGAKAAGYFGTVGTATPVTITVQEPEPEPEPDPDPDPEPDPDPDPDPDPEPEPESGDLEGVITRTGSGFEGQRMSAAAAPEPAPVVPGQVFVVFDDFILGQELSGQSLGALSFDGSGNFRFSGETFTLKATLPHASGLALYSAPAADEQSTVELAEKLRATPGIKNAFPNWILQSQATEPDDEFYPLQEWHYGQLNLPEAWDEETGSSNRVTVAVLDSGKLDHPDMTWADVGANFVNFDPEEGKPETGDIDNPYTFPGGSDHGLHVAGTIGALTDNGEGVAGVNWNVELVPVKVLDSDGSGSLLGILEGIFWAAGLDEYGHENPSPAQVVNLSLGGAILETCPEELDDIFGGLADLGTFTVAAAGNDGSPTDIFFPASCSNVITVGATGLTGARASYSNYGPHIDVMAPGGDAELDEDHPLIPDFPAVILSTGIAADGEPDYTFMQGTSMASPHVAGVVSLMLAADPTLSLQDIRTRLHEASVPLTTAECSAPALGFEGFNVCGAGLLDASAVLLGETITETTAVAYALPYRDGNPVDVAYGDIGSLERLATLRTSAEPTEDGDFTYTFEELPEGEYTVIGLELRDAANGVSSADRLGSIEVTVTAGETTEADEIVTLPLYATGL